MSTRQLLPLLLILSANVYGAEIHQWRDANGNQHFGDQPPANAQSRPVDVRPNVYTPQSNNAGHPSVVAASKPDVTLYSTAWCGFCKKARTYFRSNNIAFREYDVETSSKGKRDYARFGGNGVPIILVGEQRLQGFAITTFNRAYDHN